MNQPKKMLLGARQAKSANGALNPEILALIQRVRHAPNDRILRLPQLKAKTGHATSTTWKYVKNGTFPPPIRLGPRSVGWLESEIEAVIAARVFASRSQQAIDMKAFVTALIELPTVYRNKNVSQAIEFSFLNNTISTETE